MTTFDTTRCPHCNAEFKITAAQIAVAKGLVRCGRCYRLFQAEPAPERKTRQHAGKPLTPARESLLANIDKGLLLTDRAEKHGAGSLSDSEWARGSRYNVLDQEGEPQRDWPRLRMVVTTLASLILMAQISWFYRVKIWANPDLNSALTAICRTLPCDEPRILEYPPVITSNLIVRSHPLRTDALQADFILRNVTAELQPFPTIALRFSDASGRVVAQRMFHPFDYLSGELTGESFVPPDYDIHVALNFVDPGQSSQRYQLDLVTRVDDGDVAKK